MISYIKESVAFLKEKGFDAPKVGIVLGTGLGKLVDRIEIIKEISYNHIPNFPTSTVEFHKGKLIYGVLAGKKVVVMQGRFHLYEGYSLQDVTYPIRVMQQLGVEKFLISNASGAINKEFNKGDLMLLTDHINLQGGSPLAFRGVEHLGTRFVDMSAPYDSKMNQDLISIAQDKGITLRQGVYASVLGPQLETRAEYRFLGVIGVDAVGMSTVPEVIVANHLNIPVVAVSVLTDECDPDTLQPIDINDIIAVAADAEPSLIELFTTLFERI